MLDAGPLYRLPGECGGIGRDDELVETGRDELVFDGLQPVADLEYSSALPASKMTVAGSLYPERDAARNASPDVHELHGQLVKRDRENNQPALSFDPGDRNPCRGLVRLVR
jgi:hypothetical protein